jgi:hyaluronan synthase
MVAPMVIGLFWVARHIDNLLHVGEAHGSSMSVLWFVVFGSLAYHLVLAWMEKPYTTTPVQQQALDQLRVVVNVPVYHEDPETLKRALLALLQQTRLPQVIEVVENGDMEDTSLTEVQKWFAQEQAGTSVVLLWARIPAPGKRGAQLHTLRKEQLGSIFITMDSDTVAERAAIAEGLKPFADQRVTSVASVILAYNSKNRLVRLTDAWLLAFQVTVRAAMSQMGAVLVNSGNFSLYRTDVLKEAIGSYEAEYFRGNKVEFSDDSLLTLYAHLRGRTVQQPTSFAFTVLPEKVSHHLRQQLRWMRSSTIRSLWRFRYLPFKSIAYWEHAASWANFVLISFAFVYLVLIRPALGYGLAPVMMLFAVLVAYLTSLRYLTIRRSDQTFGSQVVSWLLSPLMLTWTAFVLRPLRIYAIATCWKTGWGTREKVEIEITQKEVPSEALVSP